MQQVSVNEAKQQLSALIDAALRGEQVLITLDSHQVVQLVPLGKKQTRRQFGSAKGLVTMSDDFDAPLKDFEEYM